MLAKCSFWVSSSSSCWIFSILCQCFKELDVLDGVCVSGTTRYGLIIRSCYMATLLLLCRASAGGSLVMPLFYPCRASRHSSLVPRCVETPCLLPSHTVERHSFHCQFSFLDWDEDFPKGWNLSFLSHQLEGKNTMSLRGEWAQKGQQTDSMVSSVLRSWAP